MDIPNASSSDLDCCKKGYLQKLSSRSFPYIPHPWKRKYCVLVKGSLYYYEREDSRGQDKGSGVINLEYYDQVLEAPPKECKKATHVFVLTSQDRSFFDPGRHLFAAESHQSMLEWMRLLKKAIEQIRNNNRTTPAVGATAGSSSNPSSPRQKQGASKTDGLSRIGAVSKLDANSKDKGKKKESEEGTEAEKNRRRKAADEDSSTKGAADNKENLEDWTNSKERKQKFSDTSLRRRRAGNPSSQSMDESSLETNNPRGGHSSLGRKKPDGQQLSESTSAHNSLGRKQTGKGKTNSSRPSPSGQEDLLTGSLGRASLADKIASKGGSANAGSGDSGGSSTSTTNMERRKRKADDDEEEQQAPLESGPQLESVTKHRVKGPAGRRMPQNRRMQSLMMKHRASSLSALAHNAELQNQDNQSASFVPWLNRSLDLLGEDNELIPTRNSQPALGYIYPDLEDLDDPDERLFEYNIGFNDENITYEENSGLFLQDGQFIQQGMDGFNNMELSLGGVPPPLPPRMESRMEYPSGQQGRLQMQNQYKMQLQQQFQQMQFETSMQQQQQQQQNQICSPFGTQQDLLSDHELKKQHRKSQPLDDIGERMMTRSMTNELFIASYSDDNSCDASNPQLHQPMQAQHNLNQQQNAFDVGSSVAHQQKQLRPKSGSRPNGQKNRRPMNQPDINRFTVAVRNLQKHVVELDQAVSSITKEVEDSKTDLGSVKSNIVTIKKDKDRLNDAISIVTQEASKMKEQVAASMKEAEKLQKTATAALVVAEKAKADQLHLKKEYEGMLKDLRNTIEDIRTDVMQNLISPSSATQKKIDNDGDIEDEEASESDDDDEMEDDRKLSDTKKKQKESARGTDGGSTSKSGGKQSFFSRPSSIISGLTSRASMGRSTTSIDGAEKEKSKDVLESPNKSKEKLSREKNSKLDSKLIEKKTKKDKTVMKSSAKSPSSPGRDKSKKFSRHSIDDFPMMDETGSPRALSPVRNGSSAINETESASLNNNYEIGKSNSSPTVPTRPRALNLKPQKTDLASKASSAASSPDSPTRPISPFDLPKVHVNGRAASPTSLHRPGSTPGPLNRQGSMTTVPEDRAVDTRTFENRPSDPPPPPPINRIFAISRQNSSPNISTQKTSPLALQRQHSLGVVLEDSKSPISRQSSVMSMPDDRLIVDQTLPMSPSPSMMSFPGSWSTTSLNKQDSSTRTNGSQEAGLNIIQKSSLKNLPIGALEQVAGGVLAGSGLQCGTICPLDESGTDPPLATSSLKKRKKVKKDPVEV